MGRIGLPGVVICIFAALFFYGCGSDGGLSVEDPEDPPEDTVENSAEIESIDLADSNGTEIEVSGSTGVDPTEIDITLALKNVDSFSVSSDGTITTTEGEVTSNQGGISTTCGDLTPVLTVTTEDATQGRYKIALGDAWRYGGMECTLTVSVDEDETSFTFRNKCAVSDDFNAQTISDDSGSTCWTISSDTTTHTRWADMLAFFGISGGLLTGDYADNGGVAVEFIKEIQSIGDFEMELFVSGTSGFAEGDGISVVFYGDLHTFLFSISLSTASAGPGDGEGDLFVACKAEDRNGAIYAANCDEETGYYIRLARSNGTFTRQYKTEDGEWTDLTNQVSTPPYEEIPSGEGMALALRLESSDGGGATFQLGHVRFTGITVENQY